MSIDLNEGNNGAVQVEQLLAEGASLITDQETKVTRGLRLPCGAIMHHIVPPFPFDDRHDKLGFAQVAVLGAAQYDARLAAIEKNERLSRVGKDMESVAVHQQAIRGAAIALMEVERAAAAADKDLSAFYEPPVIAHGDTVSPIVDAEARNYIRSLSAKELGKLMDSLQETNDPRIVRALLGVVRSPLPLFSALEQSALAAWRNLREQSDPETLGKRKARVELGNWARMVTDQAISFVSGRTQIAQKSIAERRDSDSMRLSHGLRMSIHSIVDEEQTRHLLPRFGFHPQETAVLRKQYAAA